MRAYRDLPTGIVAGAIAGLAATFIMSEFQGLWVALDPDRQEKSGKSAPLKAADRLSEAVSGEVVPEPAQKTAANAVHYMFGAALGVAYGVAAEFFPSVTAGCGSAYGGAAWLASDEIMVPMLDLGPSAAQTPLKEQLYGLVSHGVFGVALELARATTATVIRPYPVDLR